MPKKTHTKVGRPKKVKEKIAQMFTEVVKDFEDDKNVETVTQVLSQVIKDKHDNLKQIYFTFDGKEVRIHVDFYPT